jgi:flagellar biosynthesis/type III secretory pathway chaperone
MKKQELKQIIKEEINKILKDSSPEKQIKNIINQKNLQ